MSFVTSPLSPQIPKGRRSSVLRQTRENIVRLLALGSTAITSLFILVQLYLLAVGMARPAYVVGVIFISALCWTAAFATKLPYRVRASLLLMAIYAIGWFGSSSFGYAGSARLLLVIAPFLVLMTLGGRAGALGVIASILIVANTGLRQMHGGIVLPTITVIPPSLVTQFINYAAAFVLASFAGIVAIRQLLLDVEAALKQDHELERALTREGQLLEQRVAARTQALEASLEISRYISNILDFEELTAAVVRQMQVRFGYYHVQIYLLHEVEPVLHLYSSAGQPVAADAATEVPLGRGIIGRAALENRTILVPDVTLDTNWLNTAYLPHTKSELAVPLLINTQMLGVLDVQSNLVGGLNENDVFLVDTIASQVAVALQNARIYLQAERQAEHERRVQEIGRQIRQADSLEAVLQIAAEALGEAVQARRIQLNMGPSVNTSLTSERGNATRMEVK